MKKYGIIGIVFVGVAVICAFTFRGHKEADYLLTDFPAEADPVTVGNKIADRFLEQWHSQYGSPLRVDEPRTQITYPDVFPICFLGKHSDRFVQKDHIFILI